MKRSAFTVLIITITVLFFSSCSRQEDKILSLEGSTWKEANFIDHTTTEEVYWEFTDNGEFIVSVINASGNIISADTGTYVINLESEIQNLIDFSDETQNELVHSSITITDGGIDNGTPEFINSVWVILEKSDDRLVLMHDGVGQYSKEFSFIK